MVLVGTELAPVREESGALERILLSYAQAFSRADSENEALVVDADGDLGHLRARLARLKPDLVVLSNRPLWAEATEAPVLHLLHNYPDAWAAPDDERLRVALRRGRLGAVSEALARHVTVRYGLSDEVRVLPVPVEDCFFSARWDGGGGPVVFPNRILENKGVRFFLQLAKVLAGGGTRCVAFRHLAPFPRPTAEQKELLALFDATPAVELRPPPPTRASLAHSYARASAVVCPSVAPEGLGLVALEAQAVGAPLVTSGLGGLAEVTFPPNEVVSSFDTGDWLAALGRAWGRGLDTSARDAVLHRHGRPAPEQAFCRLAGEAALLV